jgi:predicted ABC-type ATPase
MSLRSIDEGLLALVCGQLSQLARIVRLHTDRLRAFDPSQPRDEHGRWTSGGGSLGTIAQDLLSEGTDHSATLAKVMGAASETARQYVRDTIRRLETVIPTNALVSAGGFKTADGKWTAARQALHDSIIEKILTPEAVVAATPAKGEKPLYTILGGRGGSGKSWFTTAGPVDRSKAVLLDSDSIKAMLPGYEGWNAAQFHEESSSIFNRADQLARSLGINVIHDSTMRTAATSAAFVDAYRKAGYRTRGYYMFLPPEIATRRAIERAIKPGGRFVPPEYVFSSRSNEASFDAAKAHFDEWALYNNNVPRGQSPHLVARG